MRLVEFLHKYPELITNYQNLIDKVKASDISNEFPGNPKKLEEWFSSNVENIIPTADTKVIPTLLNYYKELNSKFVDIVADWNSISIDEK